VSYKTHREIGSYPTFASWKAAGPRHRNQGLRCDRKGGTSATETASQITRLLASETGLLELRLATVLGFETQSSNYTTLTCS
jgi:hypothetical protein